MLQKKMKICIIIPTFNADDSIGELLDALMLQTVKPNEIIIIDSSSIDKTPQIVSKFSVNLITIPNSEFNHASTRTFAAKMSKSNILVFLTQDAIPVNNQLIENLTKNFVDKEVACVGGRQLPNKRTRPFGRHLREYNYPPHSFYRTFSDKETLGFKTVFLSNSLAAYRKQYLKEIGWFGNNISSGEDSIACARLLLEGYKICYESDAMVYHAHNYSIKEDFMRYVNIGATHKEFKCILDEFGRPDKEGIKFLKSEFKFLVKTKRFDLILQQPIRAVSKFLGYKIGYIFSGAKNNYINSIKMYK